MGLSPLPLLPCLVLAAAPGAAQAVTGTLQIRITDAAGQPLAGVVVRVEAAALQGPRQMLTDAQGQCRLPLLPLGTVKVTLLKDGFTSLTASVTVGPSTPLHQFTLRAQVAATVEVIAASSSCMDLSQCTSGRMSQEVACLAPGVYGHPQGPGYPWNTETYRKIDDAPFKRVRRDPLSTFSIDVDTASYSNVRRYLDGGSLPPVDAVRIEELLNYFSYAYPEPKGNDPFAVATEVLECPWQPSHHLVRIGLQARRMDVSSLPPRNLVFLIDVSGSMQDEHRLPLVKQGLMRLCETLRPQDHVGIVVYAGSSGLVLEPTSGARKDLILGALARLEAGGSTHGAAGIQQAYAVARQHFQKGADNRVLLCTDGDFNVGLTDEGGLVRLIEAERQSGVFLTCLGFGMGNLRDATLEQLADRGNGHYAYIDSIKEMEKVFGAGGASLVTLAKDVKLQVEFNPARVKGYRLIGYENRLLAAEDFNNDAKDAGELNAGHSVTALYEVVPPEAPLDVPTVDPLRYQAQPRPKALRKAELLTVKVRYKQPDGFHSRVLAFPVKEEIHSLQEASEDSRWAAAVATFGMVLRDAPAKGLASYALATNLAAGARGADPTGLRAECLRLMDRAKAQPARGGAQ